MYGRLSEEFPWVRQGVCRLSTNPPEYLQCNEGDLTVSPAPTGPPAFPSVSAAPTATRVAITIQINTDQYPGEIGWILEDSSGRTIAQVRSGTIGVREESVQETVLVAPNEPHVFTLQDSFGDGLCCLYGQGTAFVFLGDGVDYEKVLAYDDGRYGSSSAHTFVTSASSVIGFDSPTSSPTTTNTPTGTPSSTAAPTVQQIPALLVIEFDTYPIHTGWKLEDETTSTVVQDYPEGSYSPFVGRTMTHDLLLHTNHTYLFTVFDSQGNGLCCGFGTGSAQIYLGTAIAPEQTLVYDDGRFEFERSHTFEASMSSTFVVTSSPTKSPTVSASPTQTQAPTGPERPVTIVIEMDGYPHEIGWSMIHADTGEEVVSVAPGTYGSGTSDSEVVETIVLQLDVTYIFLLVDTWGDGLCCFFGRGEAWVYLGDSADPTMVLAYDDGQFASESRHVILVSPSGVRTVSPTSMPSPVPSVAPSVSQVPTTVEPTWAPTITSVPTSLTTEITVAVTLDRYPSEVSWFIQKVSTSEVVFRVSPGAYESARTESLVTETLAVDSGETYLFVIEDTAGDGLCCGFGRGNVYIYLGPQPDSSMVLVYEDGRYGSRAEHRFVASREAIIGNLFPSAAPQTGTTPPMGRVPGPLINITIYAELDEHPEEFGWALFDFNNNEVASATPGNYSSATVPFTARVEVYVGQVYRLVLVDAGGDGICCSSGNGQFGISLGDVAGSFVFFHSNGQFGGFALHDVLVSGENLLPGAPPFDFQASGTPSTTPVAEASVSPTAVSTSNGTTPLINISTDEGIQSNSNVANSTNSAGFRASFPIAALSCWCILTLLII